MPHFIQEAFDFVLTKKSGIKKTILRDIGDDIIHGKGFKACQEALLQRHLLRFYQTQAQYYSAIHSIAFSSQSRILNQQHQNVLLCPPIFSKFHDAEGYNGFVPSSAYLETVWFIWMESVVVFRDSQVSWTRDTFIQRSQQMIDGQIWCGDASHKISKLVYIKTPAENLRDLYKEFSRS